MLTATKPCSLFVHMSVPQQFLILNNISSLLENMEFCMGPLSKRRSYLGRKTFGTPPHSYVRLFAAQLRCKQTTCVHCPWALHTENNGTISRISQRGVRLLACS